MRGKNRIYTDEKIAQAVQESETVSDVCRKLGAAAKGGSYQLIKCRIVSLQLDTSHFLGKRFASGKRGTSYNKRKTSAEILNNKKEFREPHRALKRALIEEGIEYKCSICWITKWQGATITLDVDHINGDWSNCKIENLRFLCPNCHRQTNTFGGRNINNGALA